MSEFVVLIHEFDRFAWRAGAEAGSSSEIASYYMLYPLLRQLQRRGHVCRVATGARPVQGDVAILHVDATFVDAGYVELGALYPKTINFRATDISKRNVSGALIDRDSGWAGKVVVKTNRNVMAKGEVMQNIIARDQGRAAPFPGLLEPRPYRLLPNLARVPDDVWDDSELVVERFVPEVDPDGFAVRNWTFAGEREVCTRNVSRSWIVKSVDDVIKSTDAPVPDAIRAERDRLGLDYGNCDFVIHDGEPILLDASRTPGAPRTLWPWAHEVAPDLAEGLLVLAGT
jgi:hypothetical protein